MKFTKIFLFTLLAFFFIGINYTFAATGFDSVTVTVEQSCTGPSGYIKCSDEGGTCSFSGYANVAYGCNPSLYYRDVVTSIGCNSGAFGGDPLEGIVKACFYHITSPPINGGWTAWSPQDTTCGYYAQTRTQTRTCTNPSPAYGGADCSLLDGGNSTQTYTIPACLSNITSLSVSPTTVPYGGTTSISYSCSNGYYSHIILEGSWAWEDSGYFASRTSTTPTQTSPGSHYAMAYCYNSDWVPSLNSWTYAYYTVNNAPVNGVCGTSNGGNFYSSPSSGLCSAGTASSVSGSGPWNWSCNGLYGGGNVSCSANKTIDGGWTAWSARNESCAYYTETRTQTRTCTNPTPAYGGADCVGSTTQTYTIPACLSNITSLYVSPNVVPYGGSANIYYSCTNGYYSHVMLDDSWAWNDSGYYGSRAPTTSSAIYSPGSHYAMAYCYNSDWVPSANSWSRIGTFTVSNAPTPTPDLKVTAWGSTNADGTIETYTGSPYTLSWGAVSSATSCTINGSAVSVSGGTQGGTASLRTQSFTLTCTNATGQSASDSVTITTPPVPTNFTNSCSADAMTSTISWTAPSGYNTFYTRATNPSGTYVLYNDSATGTSNSFSISPNTNYSAWVHTRNASNGAWSDAVYTYINCARTHTLTYTADSGGTISGSSSQTVNYGTNGTAVTAVQNTGYTFASWSDGVLTATRTDTSVTANKSVTASFTLNSYTVSTSVGTGGSISPTSRTVNYGSTTTFTVTPNSGYSIGTVSGCGGSGSSTYTTGAITSACTVSATFTAVTVSVTASPTSYFTIPNTNVSFSYTPTTNIGTTECRLLDNASSALTAYQANSPIVHTPPSAAGVYGYYIQCRNTTHTTVTTTSSLITVTVVTVSVSASTPYNVGPNSSVNFVYTPTTNSGTTECLLLDNVLSPLTAYKLTSPITHTVPNNIGSYGYYVKCRNTTTTTAMANSGLIIVNTACSYANPNTSWNGSACVTPSGWITASDCPITVGNNHCSSNLVWSTTYPIGTSAVTTPTNITVSATNSGTTTYSVAHGSRNFYLYNNGNQLGTTATANATCTSGTVWNATTGICEPPTGILNASGCLISAGNNSCDTRLIWNTNNPLTGVTSVVKTPTSSGTTVATANSSAGTSYAVPYNSRAFVLIHNGVILSSATPISACAQKTTWNGSICELNAPKIDLFTADPSTIFEGRASTLTWSADPDLVTYCTGTGFSTGGLTSGTVKVSPIITTTYTLTCGRTGYPSAASTATVKVIVLKIKEQ